MIVLAVVLVVLSLIALLRFGVSAVYGEDGIRVNMSIGFITFVLYPKDLTPDKEARKAAKKEKKKLKAEKKAAKKAKERPEEEKPGTLKTLYGMLPEIKKGLGRLRRKLLIKRLTIHFVAAAEDPVKTALIFGASNAAFGAITALLDNGFRIKRRDFRSSADFNGTQHYIYVKAAISLAVWEAVYITITLVPALVRNASRNKSKTTTPVKVVTDGKDGK